jgi:hypothetical protein
MTKRKPKPLYSVTAFGERGATAIYSCLKTLCEAWNEQQHYTTIWRWLRDNEQPYDDGRLLIKKHALIKSDYTRKRVA